MTQADRSVLEEHQQFLDRFYGVSRHFYDLTRRYYLFGRDRCLAEIAKEDFSAILEVGVGTGRNLRKLHQLRPDLHFLGLEPSAEMRRSAQSKAPFIELAEGFAETCDLAALFTQPPSRILLSYCLSMVSEPRRALLHLREQLPPGGKLEVVDFGEFEGYPTAFRRAMLAWLRQFHVYPTPYRLLEECGGQCTSHAGGYYFRATLYGNS